MVTVGEFDPAESFSQSHLSNSLSLWILMRAIPPGWFYQNQVNSARTIVEKIIPIADETNRTFSVKTYLAAQNSFPGHGSHAIFHFGERMFASGLPAGVRKFALCQTAATNLADTAIAFGTVQAGEGRLSGESGWAGAAIHRATAD